MFSISAVHVSLKLDIAFTHICRRLNKEPESVIYFAGYELSSTIVAYLKYTNSAILMSQDNHAQELNYDQSTHDM